MVVSRPGLHSVSSSATQLSSLLSHAIIDVSGDDIVGSVYKTNLLQAAIFKSPRVKEQFPVISS